MRDRLIVVAHPSLQFFIFDDLDKLVRNLIEQRFSHWDVNNGDHHPAHVCAGPADVVHQFDMSNTFNDGWDLFLVLLINLPVEFVLLFFDFDQRRFHEGMAVLRSVVEWIDG